MNLIIKDICAEKDATFIANDMNFKYANGETDLDLLLDDKLHLSQKGSEWLIYNLGLENTVRCFHRQTFDKTLKKTKRKLAITA